MPVAVFVLSQVLLWHPPYFSVLFSALQLFLDSDRALLLGFHSQTTNLIVKISFFRTTDVTRKFEKHSLLLIDIPPFKEWKMDQMNTFKHVASFSER